jgi:hypothetical protein
MTSSAETGLFIKMNISPENIAKGHFEARFSTLSLIFTLL